VARHTPPSSSIDPHHSRPLTFRGYTVLLTESDGSIRGGVTGLFDYDTRILSAYRLLIDDEDPRADTSAAVESDYWEEAVRTWLLERAPGRLASALRLALGLAPEQR
jgi:hypothetical protein